MTEKKEKSKKTPIYYMQDDDVRQMLIKLKKNEYPLQSWSAMYNDVMRTGALEKLKHVASIQDS